MGKAMRASSSMPTLDVERRAVAQPLHEQFNRQYFMDDEYPYPSRHRPNAMRVVTSMAQSTLKDLIARIIGSTSRPNLVQRILST